MKISVSGTGIYGLVFARELYQEHQRTAFAMEKNARSPTTWGNAPGQTLSSGVLWTVRYRSHRISLEQPVKMT